MPSSLLLHPAVPVETSVSLIGEIRTITKYKINNITLFVLK